MEPIIITPNNGREFEYEFDNQIYRFHIDQVDETDEQSGDRIREFQILLIFTSNNMTRQFIKRFPDDRNERDSFFNSLQPRPINNFSEWEQLQ